MRRIFVFDLDGTLGKKTPSYPKITSENANYLREISYANDNLLFFATGRPKSQAILGLLQGGLSENEINKIFQGRIYEDGLYIEFDSEILYNALNDSSPLFKEIKNAFFDSQAIAFFKERGFILVPGRIVRQQGDTFQLLDYTERSTGILKTGNGLVPLYQQGNDIRETYKLPQGFFDDDLEKQAPTFKILSKIAEQHLNERFRGWKNSVELVTWPDSVEIYPKLHTIDVFIKGIGLGRVLEKANLGAIDDILYLCCDGKNDISLVKWVAERFKNYQVICPSNVSNELRDFLVAGSFNYQLLQQDCTELAKGIERLVC